MSIRDIAQFAIQQINEQVRAGIDVDGNKYKYSDKPFFMPYSKKLVDKFGKKNTSAFAVVQSGGRLGMIIKGGYKSIRQVNNRSTDSDFLTWSGQMLASITVADVTAFTATIGFNNEAARKKATWMNLTGAGKSRKFWKFFGLTKENEAKLAEYAGERVTINENLEIQI